MSTLNAEKVSSTSCFPLLLLLLNGCRSSSLHWLLNMKFQHSNRRRLVPVSYPRALDATHTHGRSDARVISKRVVRQRLERIRMSKRRSDRSVRDAEAVRMDLR